MANVKNNIVTQGLSGMLGGQLVFRQTSRGTVVGVAPQTPSGPPSAGQLAHQVRFQEAVIYAKGQAQDPAVQAEYAEQAKQEDISVYNVLLRDFMRAPSIADVDLSQYTGKVGDLIGITATDDHAVKSVHVKIENSDGSLVEEGDATQQADPNQWLYTATARNATLAGDKLTVTATDNPGHSVSKTRTL
ncbi:hypothetical protein MON38_17390 [Hymenobacter sp. DH14]|uniref:Uncharacterized protein n=1 Tax=Hymenobacter cyanobacteriorum TaxID=2926463 RepID=A0A9X2AGG3_9BACT|nr:hypothetical protein [Hymenobacter cyanobacteriorum]MCI1189201.1 hypothetical protein [Hymenobacter cyanobacteriorum]